MASYGKWYLAIAATTIGLTLLLSPPKTHLKTTMMFNTSPHYYMPNSIDSLEQFQALFTMLRTAREGDTITIHNSGYGGDAHTGIALMFAIADSKATVVMEVMGGAYSAHAIIACGADKLIMHKGGFLMYHTVQVGGVPAIYSHSEEQIQRMLDAVKFMCVATKNIITLTQWEQIVEHAKELYLYPSSKGRTN